MSQLSPKQYIQTRARSLPIYKCLVHKSWKTSQVSGVVVMRKHNNGNITAGLYDIDLLCLGVRGTQFLFNVPEEELMEHLKDSPEPFEEAGYTLAHNIVFAGHDFAMEYDIHPHKDFEITRHILEEDSDDIPIIDVPVGTGGKPHLLAITAKDRQDVLAKLQKNAGEGNFYYSVAEETDFDEYFLDSIPTDKLNCENVLDIETGELENEVKVSQRNPIEQVIIKTELYTRKLPPDSLYITPEEDIEWKKNWTVEYCGLPAGTTQKQLDEYHKVMDELRPNPLAPDYQPSEEKMSALLNKYSGNPIIVAVFYEKALAMQFPNSKMIGELHAQKLYMRYPLVKLSLALGALLQDEEDDQFEEVYNAETIREIIPGKSEFHKSELVYFALIKMLQCIDEGDLPYAVKFYYMIALSGGSDFTILPYVWAKYTSMLAQLQEGEGEDENEESGLN